MARAHRPRLLKLAVRLCGQGGIDPEELVQETLERALRSFQRLSRQDESVQRAWLCTTLTNRFIDHCRRRRTEVLGRVGLKVVSEPVALPEPRQPEQWELVSREDFRAAVGQLRGNLREIFQLHLEGRGYKEIARLRGIPVGTVGSALFTARQQLRKLLLARVDERRDDGGDEET